MVQLATPTLTEADTAIIGKLLVEALAGEISQSTWDATYKISDPMNLPDPFQHIVSFTQGFALDNKSLAKALQEEIRGECAKLLDPNR